MAKKHGKSIHLFSGICGTVLVLFLLTGISGCWEGQATKQIVMTATGEHPLAPDELERVAEIIAARLDALGGRLAKVKGLPSGSLLISFTLDDDDATTSLLNVIGRRGALRLHPVHSDSEGFESIGTTDFRPPAGYKVLPVRQLIDQPNERETWLLVEEEPSTIDNSRIRDARSFQDDLQGYVVRLSLTEKGTREFAELTRRRTGERLAIVVDNLIYVAPVIREEIRGGQAMISGRLAAHEAKDLALLLSADELPCEFRVSPAAD